jgi:hypothetical protein
LRAERQPFRECPAMLEGLDRYREEIGDLLEDS